MKLYHICQQQNRNYDTYDSAVVAAPNAAAARNMHPRTGLPIDADSIRCEDWCTGPELVTACYLGKAAKDIKQGIICASFNAG